MEKGKIEQDSRKVGGNDHQSDMASSRGPAWIGVRWGADPAVILDNI